MAKTTSAKERYEELHRLGRIAEEETGCYLIDGCVDRENVPAGVVPESEEFWGWMVSSLVANFGDRCDSYGIDGHRFGIPY